AGVVGDQRDGAEMIAVEVVEAVFEHRTLGVGFGGFFFLHGDDLPARSDVVAVGGFVAVVDLFVQASEIPGGGGEGFGFIGRIRSVAYVFVACPVGAVFKLAVD